MNTIETTWQKCLPTYLVIDVSTSMTSHEEFLNGTLQKVHRSLTGSPRVSEFAHMSIIAFSTQPWLVIEMVDMEEIDSMPRVRCNGMTNYGLAFELVRQRIDVDVPALRARGMAVLRPCVFFLTDGEPTDRDWCPAFQRLVDRNWNRRPHVITYGFGATSERVLAQVATKAAFLADGQGNLDEALSEAINSMLNSLVASARAEKIQIPMSAPSGYRSIELEYMD